jgi:hypothetical protein
MCRTFFIIGVCAPVPMVLTLHGQFSKRPSFVGENEA